MAGGFPGLAPPDGGLPGIRAAAREGPYVADRLNG